MKPKLDNLYVYKQGSNKSSRGVFLKLDKRVQTKKFIDNAIQTLAGYPDFNVPPSTRYAQTFDIKGNVRTMLMLTECNDDKKVGAFFKEMKKKIESAPLLKEAWDTAGGTPVDTMQRFMYE